MLNQKPGINKSGWFFNTPEEAKNKAISLINNENCYYLITWTIYRINDIKGDISEFVFNNNRSVFSYFVEYNKYEKGFVEIKNSSDEEWNGKYFKRNIEDTVIYIKDDNHHIYNYEGQWKIGLLCELWTNVYQNGTKKI